MKLIDLPKELSGGIRKPGETFIMMGMMTIRIKYNDIMDITAIVVNGQEIENPTSIRIENGSLKVDTLDKTNGNNEVKDANTSLENANLNNISKLDSIPSSNLNNIFKEVKGLTLDSIPAELRDGINKASIDGRPAEIFSIVGGSTIVRISYDQATREVKAIEINGELVENPQSITYVDGKINVTTNTTQEENKFNPTF